MSIKVDIHYTAVLGHEVCMYFRPLTIFFYVNSRILLILFLERIKANIGDTALGNVSIPFCLLFHILFQYFYLTDDINLSNTKFMKGSN